MEKYLKQIGHLSRNQLLLLAARQQQNLENQEQPQTEPIAIVGMACRFPGDVRDPQSFWEALENGHDLMCKPEAIGRHFDSRHPEDLCMGLLRDIDQFDAAFFRLSEREVEQMDPQQRLLLEVGWEALECGGYNPRGQKETLTGVFIGISSNDYGRFSTGGDIPSIYGLTGNASSVAAGRIAYMLGLQGPAVSIDTACSSSLVSLHLACQSLKLRESHMALVGGVNLILDSYNTASFYDAGMLAPDGHCKTFDASADGFARAEGCGMIVLKRLSDAQRDGDNIRAVIQGSAVNQDGRSQGLTAPNELSQVKLLRAALKDAGLKTSDIDYIECHGTGTSLGDPIEFSALATVFGNDQDRQEDLVMGSVKTNMGHAEAASGMAGLLKTILSIEHGMIPSNRNFHRPSPHISWDRLSVKFPTQCMPWHDTAHPRTAGISSFGFSGTNAHILLAQAPVVEEKQPNQPERSHHLITLSAETPEALVALAKRYDGVLADGLHAIGDICFSANTGRYDASHRMAIVAENPAQLQSLMKKFVQRELSPEISHAYTEDEKKIVFLFSGQGSQYAGMGHDLYRSSTVFRQAIDRCEAILASELDRSLTSLLWGDHTHLLHQTEYTQPVLFAFEYALATLWQSWGIQPDVLIGHSLGEYVAACIAGVFSLEDGMKLVAARGRLLAALCPPGSMMSIAAPADVVTTLILPFPGISIAAENGPASTVVAGESGRLQALETHLQAQALPYQMLAVSHAFHSPLVEPMCEAFAEVLSQIEWARPRRPVISNLTGDSAGDNLCTPAYWLKHLLDPVKFYRGIRGLEADGVDIYLEIGPSTTLVGMARQCLTSPVKEVLWLPSLRRGNDEWLQILMAASQLYVHGKSLDWHAFDQGHHRHRVVLPTYPFEVASRSFWCQPQEKTSPSYRVIDKSVTYLDETDLALLPQIIPMADDEWLFCLKLDQHHPSFLQDHSVQGEVIVPAAMFVELALEAAKSVLKKDEHLHLSSIEISQVLAIPDGANVDLQIKVKPAQDGAYRFSICSLQSQWKQHCCGMIDRPVIIDSPLQRSRQQIRQQCSQHVPMSEYYTRMEQGGLELGHQFQTLKQIWNSGHEAFAQIELSLETDQAGYCLHPLLLDACFQMLAALLPEGDGALYLPCAVSQVRVFSKQSFRQIWATARLTSKPSGRFSADFELISDNDQLIAKIEGLQLVPFSGRTPIPMTFYQRQWLEWQPEGNGHMSPVQEQWLILADQSGFAQKLAEILMEEGNQVFLVYADSLPAELAGQEKSHFVLDPEDHDGFEQLLSLLSSQTTQYSGLKIIHCWNIDICGATQSSRLGGAGILNLVQAMAKIPWSDIPTLTLVTEQAHSVVAGADDQVTNPASAMLWGMADVIRIEHPEFVCLSVDIQHRDQAGYTEQARQLFTLLQAPRGIDQVAIRRGGYFKAELRQQTPSQQSRIHIRDDRSYLVTGAFGGIGRQVTAWLAEQGAGHLILLGRSEPQEPQTALVDRLGVPVTILTCDVSEAESLNQALSRVSEQISPLAGILHLAGEVHDAVLMKQEWKDFALILAPKMLGSWNLHQFTEDYAVTLDFFACFSSVASMFGSAGQAAYSSANAFMDGLMQFRRQRGLPGVSINWGSWDVSGMAEHVSGQLEKVGLLPISSEQGLQELSWLLDTTYGQIGAVRIDWPRFFRYLPEGLNLSILDSMRQTPPSQAKKEVSTDVTQWHHLPQAEQQQQLDAYVRQQVASLLGHLTARQIRPRDKFFDIGFDSMMAVELKNRLQSGLGLTLPPTLLFDYPNAQALSHYLGELIFGAVTDDEPATKLVASGDVDDIKSLDDSDIDKLLDDLIKENVW